MDGREPEKQISSTEEESLPRKSAPRFLLIALCAIAASTMLVEIVLVKFVAFKVFHHFINMIVSTVVLSFAAAGTYLYTRGGIENRSEELTWQAAARDAALYSTTLIAAVLLFCWVPIDPYNADLAPLMRLAALPTYFAFFFVPFFFGGLCISRVLANSPIRPSRVLLFDLVAAAVAASAAPMLLELLGGYGAIGLAAGLGAVAFFAFERATGRIRPRQAAIWTFAFLATGAVLQLYPGWAMKTYGLDIISNKAQKLTDTLKQDFGGIDKTYWNPLARIDISNVGWSNDIAFFYNFRDKKEKLEGRLITVDKWANTRQFANRGKLQDQKFFAESLLSLPYIARPNPEDVLIIGGGGGVDISMAKYFNVPRITALEMNPMTYKHVLMGEGDPQKDLFQPWIQSDQTSKVSILNKEARHFSSACPPQSYDVIQATGVDTFTAVASGALAYSDNYLYTLDAVKSYYRLLKPGGLLSISNLRGSGFPMRLFVTYLTCLDDLGIKNPGSHIIVVGGLIDAELMVKTTPFTPLELASVRDWCKRYGYDFIFDPERVEASAPGHLRGEDVYTKLAFSEGDKRQQLIDANEKNIFPVSDDKPYFYQLNKNEDWLFSRTDAYTPVLAILLMSFFSLGLIILPMKNLSRQQLSLRTVSYAVFFALSGFAFLFFEVSTVQLFTVFVGGPTYSLAVVLVSVLAGYSIGCFLVSKLTIRRETFIKMGVLLFTVNLLAYFFLPGAVSAMMVLEVPARLTIASAFVLSVSCLAGLPVPLALESAKQSFSQEISWFWGVNCAFNALGAACFPLISIHIGISATLAVVAVLYLLANLLFAFVCLPRNKAN